MLISAVASDFWSDCAVQLIGSVVGAFLGFILAIITENYVTKHNQKKENLRLLENLENELNGLKYISLATIYDIAACELFFVPCLEEVVRSQSIQTLLRKQFPTTNSDKKTFFDKLKELELQILRINNWYERKNDFYFVNQDNIMSFGNILKSQKKDSIKNFDEIDRSLVKPEETRYLVFCQYLADEIYGMMNKIVSLKEEINSILQSIRI